MPKEVYYTVSDELKEKGMASFIISDNCHHHYLVVCSLFSRGNVWFLLNVFCKHKLNRM